METKVSKQRFCQLASAAHNCMVGYRNYSAEQLNSEQWRDYVRDAASLLMQLSNELDTAANEN